MLKRMLKVLRLTFLQKNVILSLERAVQVFLVMETVVSKFV